jgi:hypothetical protein
MLTLTDVRCNTRPICSAMPMNLQRVEQGGGAGMKQQRCTGGQATQNQAGGGVGVSRS